MKSNRLAYSGLIILAVLAVSGWMPAGQETSASLPIHYEELTAPLFVQAVARSGGTCIIPLGIIEKHGEHLPLGTDLLICREKARLAAQLEYAVVFPPYYFGQIFEARHQPGTLAYSEKLYFDLLQETCAELARNGFHKIILYSGHGGNEHFLPYFCQTQLASRKDYAVYLFTPAVDPEQDPEVQNLIRSAVDMHGGERETSLLLAIAPQLVHLEAIKPGSGEDRKRLSSVQPFYTGIWWYASFPDHYAGDATVATVELGQLLLRKQVEQLAAMIREVKQDQEVLKLQNEFFNAAGDPLAPKK